jgi:actin-related protein
MSRCTYPFVYISENVGLAGNRATLYEQIGFSLADIVAKAMFGSLFVAIASEKYTVEEDDLDLSDLSVRWFWWSLATTTEELRDRSGCSSVERKCTTGIVMDSGDDASHTLPIHEGYALPHAILAKIVADIVMSKADVDSTTRDQ